MTKEEAVEILQTIQEMYPDFGLTKRKAIVLIPNMLDMDFKGVMQNLSIYAMKFPNPPYLQSIAAYPKEEDKTLQQVQQWQEEAKLVPQEVRDAFEAKFAAFIQQMKGS